MVRLAFLSRINFSIWMAETMSLVLILPGGDVLMFIYLILTSTLTPILYFVGVEANRQDPGSNW